MTENPRRIVDPQVAVIADDDVRVAVTGRAGATRKAVNLVGRVPLSPGLVARLSSRRRAVPHTAAEAPPLLILTRRRRRLAVAAGREPIANRNTRR